MKWLKPLLCAVALTWFAGAAGETSLAPATVDRWIASMTELRQWSEQRAEEGADTEPRTGDARVDMEEMLARFARDSEEVEAIVDRHGFTGRDQWAEIGSRIFNAYVAIRMREQAPEIEQQMQESIRQIDENPYMEEDQKEMMRQQLATAHEQFAHSGEDLPPGDLEAVRERRAALDTYFDERGQ